MITPEQQAACDAEAGARVRWALAKIEEAQGLMGDACAILSTLQGASPEWKVTSGMYDKIKASWYRVRNALELGPRARKLRLDPLASETFLQRRARESAKTEA